MRTKVISSRAVIEKTTTNAPAKVIIRGGGEIGFTTLELAMLRPKAEHPIDIHLITRAKYADEPWTDKFWIKAMDSSADFASRSNYSYARIIKGINVISRNDDGSMDIVFDSDYGRKALPARLHFEKDGTDIKMLPPLLAAGNPAMMIDATGQVKYEFMQGYLQYPGLLTIGTAPGKNIPKGTEIPHMLFGVNMGNNIPQNKWLNLASATNPTTAALLYTGSCTTHGGTVLLRALAKNIDGFEIISGNLSSIHSRTPSDLLEQLDLNFAPQSTGFAKAAKVVANDIAGVANIDAYAVRANVAGSSFYTLTMNVKAKEILTKENLLAKLQKEAEGPMSEQLAIISQSALAAHNKKNFSINSAMGMKGLLQTAIIDPDMLTVKDNGDGTYQINFKVVYYDNVGGFTHELLMEASEVANQKWDLAGQIFSPGNIWDYNRIFSFFNNPDNPNVQERFGTSQARWDKIASAVEGEKNKGLLIGQPENFVRM
ncbi:MAG: hypothetical protein DKM50_02695 [Candidatus Margulisiibacteriota bacterium]|nr:MAG: hypothetical protein A2X43_03530 [Candidatus Margulisbacteria bacterium GWD2_39_127]OGI02514.1 MAG: hypothetical protein A2X42_07515 [Candidatus Margulisbacteria bacterium GWF2_38_17]OGI11007.1 MAG: hypothetical protein A2X41_02040 [Candidatus Margulisbacteria bacterium GWE2_39_32]PZM83201.1 MAG: hypothetical protein DKM50_02695 [Candidatus Margulisiibacteriota bacterium]HAR62494.1 hypothetical protein [Candidatus Margulisiibacteriota bacterium]